MFTAEVAQSAGYSLRQVRYRLAKGWWHRVAGRGISVDPPPSSGWPAPILARAASVTWPDTVVGFRVAAALVGFPVRPGPAVHVLTAVKRRPLHEVVPHWTPVRADEVWTGPFGVRLTRPVRTALDCLATFSDAEADDLYAWLATRRRLTPERLEAALQLRKYRHGTTNLRELRRRTASGAVSDAERRVHQALRCAGIDGWEANVRVADADGLIGIVDLLFREARVVVEIDGRRAHDTEDRFVEDRRRQNRLVNAGYRVLRFTWPDIIDRPAALVTEIRAALCL